MLISDALTAACDDLLLETKQVPLVHWNESVFRFFLVKRLLAMSQGIECYSEWSRVDLVVREPAQTAFVELKFFVSRPLHDSDRKFLRWKGGAGKKNFQEFMDVVAKMQEVRSRPEAMKWGGRIDSAFVVLAYADPIRPGRRITFGDSYDSLSRSDQIQSVTPIVERTRVMMISGVWKQAEEMAYPVG